MRMVIVDLQNLLQQKNITRYKLSKETGIKFQTIDNYYKNKVVRYDGYVLSQICKVLNCTVGDILIYQNED
ncbi:MAG: helix-turn-helix transcriptional regulator [Oscillospiraceae bacterium]|nr:helix-turn-helix transcriptional regulator [Oscillospiraceae bacterium]MBR6923590.1 helix-turn-helix transcriptional regulator [Oscillospiraceae bacterium]